MTVLLANNAASKLAGSVDTIQTAIAVTAGDGAKFPAPTGDDWFPVTLEKISEGVVVREILRCTSRTGDTLTVTRAQEGTDAETFLTGDRAELRITKGAFDQFNADVQAFADAAQVILQDTQATLENTQAAVEAFINEGEFITYTLASGVATATLDLAVRQVFRVDASSPRTLAFDNAPGADKAMTVVVHITGNSAVTWPAGIDWDSDAAPELGDNETKVILFWDGVEWSGFVRVAK